MRTFLILYCLALASVKVRSEPPVFMGLQQHNQRTLPLNVQLPQEQNFGNFIDVPPNYGVLADSFAPNVMERAAFEDSYNAAYRHSSDQHHQTGYEQGPGETVVHKHIYVHAPPKDFETEDAVQPRVTPQAGHKQKHYKIVFIKAPEAPIMRTPSVAPLPQNEEKTLIYVLHKRPETQPDIVIPTPEPTKPSKPEVYFIKYKTKKDEAPVYGPPAAFNEFKLRQADAHVNNDGPDFMPMNPDQYQMEATTQQSQYPADERSQYATEEASQLGAELYNAVTMRSFVNENFQSTTVEPLNQYLPPKATLAPIVVKDMEQVAHVPASLYGTLNKTAFFIKKRK